MSSAEDHRLDEIHGTEQLALKRRDEQIAAGEIRLVPLRRLHLDERHTIVQSELATSSSMRARMATGSVTQGIC
jgi:hypothetical protein